MRFVDTNVLLYTVSTAPAEAPKKRAALLLLDADDLALSVQVLQEFYVQATRSTRADPLSHDQAQALVEAFMRFRVQDDTVPIMKAAMESRHNPFRARAPLGAHDRDIQTTASCSPG